MKNLLKLNVGCGADLKVGWVNLDKQHIHADGFEFDLSDIPRERLPFEDGSVGKILMSHVIEHLANPLEVMQELWRVATNGCELVIRVPHGGNDEAWIDPTHLRPYFPRSFNYFSQPKYYKFDYGYTADWRCEAVILVTGLLDRTDDPVVLQSLCDHNRNTVSEMLAILTALKPSRQRSRELMTSPKIQFVSSVSGDFDEITNFVKKK